MLLLDVSIGWKPFPNITATLLGNTFYHWVPGSEINTCNHSRVRTASATVKTTLQISDPMPYRVEKKSPNLVILYTVEKLLKN